MDLFDQLTLAFLPKNQLRIIEIEWERKDEGIIVSTWLGDELSDVSVLQEPITIKHEDFEKWLDDEGYLKGTDEVFYMEGGSHASFEVSWDFTYEEFEVTDYVIREYLRDQLKKLVK